MKRRNLLKLGLGVGTAALTVSFVVARSIPVIPKRPEATNEAALGWIRHQEGRFVLHLPRVEIGQNIATALKQVACDELGVGWDDVALKLHTTRSIEQVRATVGSESVKDFAIPLAQACATLRDAMASGQAKGALTPSAEPRPLSDLRAFAKDASFVGHPVPLEQGEDILRGKPVYAGDIQRPGSVYGRVLRAPVSPEIASSPVQWDLPAAEALPGFLAVVEDPLLVMGQSQGLGILATTPGTLDRIAAALDVEWSVGEGFSQEDIDTAIDVDTRLSHGRLAHQLADEDIDEASDWDIDLRIDLPLAAHAPIEPRAAVAGFNKDGGLQLWVGSQDAFYVRDVLARKLALSASQIDVHSCRVGGGFGGKTICTVELEAAVLARAAKRPVKVQWTRAQEFQLGFHRPPTSHRLRAKLRDGQLADWWHAFASSHIFFTNAALPPWIQLMTDLIGDAGVVRGARPPYHIERQRIEYDVLRLPVFVGPWRGLGAGPNALAIESAIDECSRHSGTDPLAFRLAHIEDPRLARTLKRVAERAAWQVPLRDGLGRGRKGRGIACGIYKEMSYAAVVAEVKVDDDGALRLTHLWCAHDCGRVINPDQVRAQCEGNLVWGIGMVLSDHLPVADAAVAAENFADAPIPGLADVPPMTIDLVDEGEAPSGAGETAIVAAAGAIANAIRDATGIRPSRFPITPDHLRTRQS